MFGRTSSGSSGRASIGRSMSNLSSISNSQSLSKSHSKFGREEWGNFELNDVACGISRRESFNYTRVILSFF